MRHLQSVRGIGVYTDLIRIILYRADELLRGARLARLPVGPVVQGSDHHQQVAALGLEHTDGVVAPFVDGVTVPVQHAQSPPDGHHRASCADWHRGQICRGSGGWPDSALRPNAIVRGANRMPHAAITLPRLIVPRCVSWSSVDRKYQLTGNAPESA